METRGDKSLIMVTADNNNKFYKMHDNGDGTFSVEYGRVGVTKTCMNYPIKKWDSIYRDKTGKGYRDVTELRAEKVVSNGGTQTFADIKIAQIKSLVTTLQAYAKKSVTENYTVTSEAVTQAQVDEAQSVLDRLTTLKVTDTKILNDTLLELYKVIPRRMANVKYHLFGLEEGLALKDDIFKRTIETEQATLDVMRGQVSTNSKTKDVTNKAQTTLLQAMGLEIVLIEDSDQQAILKLLGPNARQFRSAYKVINVKTQGLFDKKLGEAANKSTNLFWHGSRNENWWSILDSGLVIRPSNAVYTGSMFGDGIYFADKAQKSIGYTSLRGSYWASGSANKAYLAVFHVHTGNWWRIKNYNYSMGQLNERSIKAKGYDSVFAEGGADLRNNEYIVYNKAQCTVRYLVEIGD
jgi:poly [ADP-ribose] polymerase